MRIFRSPDKIVKGSLPAIFLAGSIDNGSAENWQAQLEHYFSHAPVDIYNPRRNEWQATALQQAEEDIMKEQVEWELNALQQADLIIMNLLPNTLSPVSMMELGLYAKSRKLWVCCPDEFWRSANVKLCCRHYRIPCFDTMNELLNELKL